MTELNKCGWCGDTIERPEGHGWIHQANRRPECPSNPTHGATPANGASEAPPAPVFPSLDELATTYDPLRAGSFEAYLKGWQVREIRKHLAGSRMLELGCSTGLLSELLHVYTVGPGGDHLIVEGARGCLEATHKRVPDARYVLSRWEDFELAEGYPKPTDVIASGVLEHVDDPFTLLNRIRGWLAPRGRLHVVVANAESFHRLVGFELGIIPDFTTVTDADIAQGHRRHYNRSTLIGELHLAGFTEYASGWLGFKPLPGESMLTMFSPPQLEALHTAGRAYCPDGVAELYVCAT